MTSVERLVEYCEALPSEPPMSGEVGAPCPTLEPAGWPASGALCFEQVGAQMALLLPLLSLHHPINLIPQVQFVSSMFCIERLKTKWSTESTPCKVEVSMLTSKNT